MPAANQRASLIPYHIRSFLGGSADYEDKGIAGSFKAGMNLDIRKQKDTLTCGYALKDDLALGFMTAPAYCVVPASDGNTYFFCNDGKIFRRKSNGSYLLGGGGAPTPVWTDTFESGTIIGACEWFSSAGFTYLIWATKTRLNIKKITGPAYTQVEPWIDVNVADAGSWPKTNLNSVSWHTMTIANGTLQIVNGSSLALVGYDLSYTNNALQLIPGNKAVCILERGKYGVIGCQDITGKNQTAFFAWDGIGLSWNDKQIVKYGQLHAMYDTEIALAQIGTNGQLYIADFNTSMPFRQIRGGGQADIDGICGFEGMALIGIYNNTNLMNGVLANGVYSIGRINKNAPIVLNLEYQLTCDRITSVKSVGDSSTPTILVAYQLGSQYGVKAVDQGTYATGIYQTLDLIAPLGTRRYPIPLGRLLEWTKVDLQCTPMQPGCKIECWYKIDKLTLGGPSNDGWYQANTDLNNTGSGLQLQGDNIQNGVFYIGQKGRTIEVMLKLLPSGNRTPEVNEVNIYFSVG